MAATFHELVDSGEPALTKDGKSLPLKYISIGSDDRNALLAKALIDTPVVLEGMGRRRIAIDLRGNGVAFVTVEYDSATAPAQALGVDGLPGGDNGSGEGGGGGGGPGGTGGAAADGEKVPSNFSFTTGGGTRHITQSLETVEAVSILPGGPPDTNRTIGVSADGVEGVDIVAPAHEFTITVPSTDLTYERQRFLAYLVGKTNKAPFKTFKVGEVLFLGADGAGGDPQPGMLTCRFRPGQNLEEGHPHLTIAPGLVLSAKKAHEYVWVQYERKADPTSGLVFMKPTSAFRERVYGEDDFEFLGVGT